MQGFASQKGTLIGNLVSCGTIMYPERNGQKPGQIAPLVAVLDGVGLLFFPRPEEIAFAVDFNNHLIYVPHGHTSGNSSAHQYLRSPLDGKLDKASIEKYVLAETGVAINLQPPDMVITRRDSACRTGCALFNAGRLHPRCAGPLTAADAWGFSGAVHGS